MARGVFHNSLGGSAAKQKSNHNMLIIQMRIEFVQLSCLWHLSELLNVKSKSCMVLFTVVELSLKLFVQNTSTRVQASGGLHFHFLSFHIVHMNEQVFMKDERCIQQYFIINYSDIKRLINISPQFV